MSIDPKKSLSFNVSLPVVNRLSGNLLMASGWERKGTTYYKGEDEIHYDGLHWVLNKETRIEFYQDIKPKQK